MTAIADDPLLSVPGKPLWLMTLADLALLLVGFFVLIQANDRLDARAVAAAFAKRAAAASAPVAAPAMPVDTAAVEGFAPGSAQLAQPSGGTVAWATAATRDPRVALTIAGATDGSAADVDRATGSAALLAIDRARAVAALLADAGVPTRRLLVTNQGAPAGRHVTLTLAFTGETATQDRTTP